MGKKQFFPPQTIPLTEDAFRDNGETALYWLTAAGMMINCHGTIILVDPNIMTYGKPAVSEADHNMVIKRFPPVYADSIPKVDYVLFTHADIDHMGPITLPTLAEHTNAIFIGTGFTVDMMVKRGVPRGRCIVHEYGDVFKLDDIIVIPTPADHAWQLEWPVEQSILQFGIDDPNWHFKPNDCCGFKFITPDGIIWHPGDTALLYEHLTNTDVDVMFYDVGDNPAHWTTRNSIRLYEALKDTDMILYHYGTYDAPDVDYANGSPEAIEGKVSDMSRLKVIAPGEKYVVHSKH